VCCIACGAVRLRLTCDEQERALQTELDAHFESGEEAEYDACLRELCTAELPYLQATIQYLSSIFLSAICNAKG
jgi:hypothetical protein